MIAEVVLYIELPNGTDTTKVCRAVRRAVLTDMRLDAELRPTVLFPARCRVVDAPPVSSEALPVGSDTFGADGDLRLRPLGVPDRG